MNPSRNYYTTPIRLDFIDSSHKTTTSSSGWPRARISTANGRNTLQRDPCTNEAGMLWSFCPRHQTRINGIPIIGKSSHSAIPAEGILTVVISTAGILNVRILNAGNSSTGNCTAGICTVGICTVLQIGILTAGNFTVVLKWNYYRRILYCRNFIHRNLYRRNLHHPCQAI